MISYIRSSTTWEPHYLVGIKEQCTFSGKLFEVETTFWKMTHLSSLTAEMVVYFHEELCV